MQNYLNRNVFIRGGKEAFPLIPLICVLFFCFSISPKISADSDSYWSQALDTEGQVLLDALSSRATENMVEIGDGTTYKNYPFRTQFMDCRTQIIYLSSELGSEQDYHALAFKFYQYPGTISNCTIRMKHTSKTNYDSQAYWEGSGWTVVYTGAVQVDANGWARIGFGRDFAYDGSQNVMLDIFFDRTSYNGKDGYVYATETASKRSIYRAYDNAHGMGNPAYWIQNLPEPYSGAWIPDIRFYGEDPSGDDDGGGDDGGGETVEDVNDLSAWVFEDNSSDGFQSADRIDYTAGTGIGFDLGASGPDAAVGNQKVMLSGWRSPNGLDGGEASQSSVYEAVFTIKASAGTISSSPGYRIKFSNRGFSHQGSFMMENNDLSSIDNNYSTNDTAFLGYLHFSPPGELTDMGDNGAQADWAGTGQDFRDYAIGFEVVGNEGETGTLLLESVSVSKFSVPSRQNPVIAWGSSGDSRISGLTPETSLAFNESPSGWVVNENANVTGFTLLTPSDAINANNISTSLAAASGKRNLDLVCTSGVGTVLANSLYRFTVDIQSSSATTAPICRFSFQARNLGTAVSENFGYKQGIWEYNYNRGEGISKILYYRPDNQTVLPCAPPTSGALVDMYIYSHDQYSDGDNSPTLLPSFSMFDEGTFDIDSYETGGWDTPNATVTINYAGWELISGGTEE